MLNLRVGEVHLGQGLRLVPCGNTWTENVNRCSKLFIKFLCWSCRSTRPHMERPTEQSSRQPEIHHCGYLRDRRPPVGTCSVGRWPCPVSPRSRRLSPQRQRRLPPTWRLLCCCPPIQPGQERLRPRTKIKIKTSPRTRKGWQHLLLGLTSVPSSPFRHNLTVRPPSLNTKSLADEEQNNKSGKGANKGLWQLPPPPHGELRLLDWRHYATVESASDVMHNDRQGRPCSATRPEGFADHTSRYVTPSDCHIVPGYSCLFAGFLSFSSIFGYGTLDFYVGYKLQRHSSNRHQLTQRVTLKLQSVPKKRTNKTNKNCQTWQACQHSKVVQRGPKWST